MILDRFPEIRALSFEERIQLYSELGEELFPGEPVTDPALIAELERRMEEYRRDPSTGSSWEEVRARLHAKRRVEAGA